MPMIDVYATDGTFADPGSLAQRLAATLMRIEEVPALPMFRNNTAAFVHALPDGAIANVEGESDYVRVQVLTNLGALDRAKQLAVVEQFTDIVADAAGPEKVTKLVLVDVVPRYEKDGSARIRDFMFSHVHGFESLEEAADAVAAYLPHRTKPRSPQGLKRNLRRREGRWYWHWDPKFLTAPADDAFVREEKLEQAAIDLTIPILLIRGKLSDVVSPEGVRDFLAKVPRAEFVELSDAGHTAAGDDNDAFSEAVVQFVSR